MHAITSTKSRRSRSLWSGQRGFVSTFTAAITPDVGLTPTGLPCLDVRVPDVSGEEVAVT